MNNLQSNNKVLRHHLTFKLLGLCLCFITTIAKAQIAPDLRDEMALKSSGEKLGAMIRLDEQFIPNLKKAPLVGIQRHIQRVKQLKQQASQSQKELVYFLDKSGIKYHSFWVANLIYVEATPQQLVKISQRADVSMVSSNQAIHYDAPVKESSSAQKSTQSIEWGLEQISAPEAWALGFTGQGVVVAGQDTGYEWDHPALKSAYLGWNADSVDHNYHWHNAIHSLDNSQCDTAAAQLEPCDDNSHGTHTMGTMVGDDGLGNQIGVAPDARWIACRNMDDGNGTPLTYTECFQWLMAPTDLNDQNADPARAPHVINNSWGCPGFEGCSDPETLRLIVENVVDSGIFVVVSAGNSGSSCNTIFDPPALYSAAFTVGSTTSSDSASSFSSRGPVTVDGNQIIKPEIAAPGSGVRSSVPGGGYGSKSGTSMAGPHVAGAVALLLSAHPELKWQPERIREIMINSTDPLFNNQTCGGVDGSDHPNNTFGFGRINVLKAVLTDPDVIFFTGFESND